MNRPISRREILGGMVSAGTVALLRTNDPSSQVKPILIGGRQVEITVTSVSSHTIRIRLVPLENGGPNTVPYDSSPVQENWAAPGMRIRSLTQPVSSQLKDLAVKIGLDPLTIVIEARDGRVVQRLRFDQETGSMSFIPGKGPVLGLGEGGPQFDRRGSADQMRSGQGGYRLRTHGGRVPIPWLIGTDGWAMFIPQPFGTFDLTGQEGRMNPGSPATALPMDLFIMGAREPAQVMAEYARLTGRPEMPPLWSLGYLQSHRTLRGPDEIMWVARTFREKKLPCDALIYLGTDFAPSGWNTHNGEFTWHPTNFPDPKKMIDELHAQHFKVVLHTVLEGRRLRGTVNDPCTAAPLPSGRTPDGKWPDDRQVSCYWPVHKPLYDAGIDGWWPDQGDGLDGPSRLARHRMYWEGSRQLRPNERPFALHRNGQAGMQRFAAFLWSGDVYSTWETLKTHVPVAVNTGLTGIPYWGTDIGGFVPTKEYTGELHVRWFQFGAFCPLFRSHGRTWHLRLPWGWNTGELGPSEVANYTGGAASWKCDLTSYACSKLGPAERRGPGAPLQLRGPLNRPPDQPKASPDGAWQAFVKNYNIYLQSKDKKEEFALSFDGSEDNYYTLASIRWSPDSRKIAAYRVRPGYHRKIQYVESSPVDQLQPKYSTVEYAKPGDTVDVEQPVLFLTETKKQIAIDNTLFPNPYEMSRAR
jgi:alpha-glucosidase